MDLDVLMKSYKKYDNEPHIERVNISILEMIQAYDIDHKRIDLLDTAQGLSKWLSNKYSVFQIRILTILQYSLLFRFCLKIIDLHLRIWMI